MSFQLWLRLLGGYWCHILYRKHKGEKNIGGRRKRLILVFEVEVSKGHPRGHSKPILLPLMDALTLGAFILLRHSTNI